MKRHDIANLNSKSQCFRANVTVEMSFHAASWHSHFGNLACAGMRHFFMIYEDSAHFVLRRNATLLFRLPEYSDLPALS